MVSQVHRCRSIRERQELQVHKGTRACFLKLEVFCGRAEYRLQCAMGRGTESQEGQVGCLGKQNHTVVIVTAIPGANTGTCSFQQDMFKLF